MKALPPLKGGWCCSSTDRSFRRAESQSVQPGQGSPSQASLQLFKQNYLEILKKQKQFRLRFNSSNRSFERLFA